MIAILGFVGGWAIRTSVIILLTALAGSLLRRLSADARNVVWRCALAGSLLTWFGMLIIPAVGLSARIPASPIAAALDPRVPPVYTVESPVRKIEADNLRSVTSHHVEAIPVDDFLIWKLVGFAYVAGVLVTLARWGASLGRTLSICRAARPADGFDDALIAERPELTVPFTLGWLKPLIVLPADCVAWSDQRWGAVILHERSHMKRKDWIWQSAATMTAALQWFNPAVWLLAARLRATAEEAADNDVLAAGVAPSVYARELMAFATVRPGAELAATAAVGRRNIVTRLRFILAANRVRKPAKRNFVLATAGSFGLVSLALAACVAAPIDASAIVGAMFLAQGEAKFSDGVRVSVVYVGPAESSRLPVWRSDGSASGGTGESLSHGGRYSAPASFQGKRGVVVAYDLTGMPPRDPDADPFRLYIVRLGGEIDNGGGAGGLTPIHAHNHFYVPESWTLADFQIGRGFGKYQLVADNREGEGSLPVQVIARGETRETHPVNGKTVESRHSASEIKFTIPSAVKDKDWRLRAFDAAGNSLRILVNYGSERSSPDHLTFHANCNAAPESIERFVLDARDYEWVTIKNLHLFPNSTAIHP